MGSRPLVSLQGARRLVLDQATRLSSEGVDLGAALGRTLAGDVVSEYDVPGHPSSAMDGFAVRAADGTGPGVVLRLNGESRAGHHPSFAIGAGEAARISTGATLPRGADAVVRLEHAVELGDVIRLASSVAPGRDVRPAGDVVRRGSRVLSAGTKLRPVDLAALAAVGRSAALCTRMPRVSLVTTGDELRQPGQPLEPGQIWDANSYAVAAQAQNAGAQVVHRERVRDDLKTIRDTLERCLECDILVVCGGVSAGRHDHVRAALGQLGVEELFTGVALRPGRPTCAGLAGGEVLVFALPGNPVAALVAFHLFARAAIGAMLGRPQAVPFATAVLDVDYEKRPGLTHALLCTITGGEDRWHVRPTRRQGSHLTGSFAEADGLAFIDSERSSMQAGERVPFELI